MEEERCDLISLVCHLRVNQQTPDLSLHLISCELVLIQSRSSNPCINKRQKHYQEYNNPLYFSCGSPGYHATDRIEVNISSSGPTSNTAEPFTATNTAQSSSSTPVSTKVQQLETVVEDDEALFLGGYVTQAEDSWIPIYDEVIRDDNDIEDLDLGVSSIELDACDNLLIDIIIPPTTPSDKVPQILLKKSAQSASPFIKPVPMHHHKRNRRIRLKEKSSAFAIIIDMDILYRSC